MFNRPFDLRWLVFYLVRKPKSTHGHPKRFAMPKHRSGRPAAPRKGPRDFLVGALYDATGGRKGQPGSVSSYIAIPRDLAEMVA